MKQFKIGDLLLSNGFIGTTIVLSLIDFKSNFTNKLFKVYCFKQYFHANKVIEIADDNRMSINKDGTVGPYHFEIINEETK